MNEDLLKAAVDKFKEGFTQVIVESKRTGTLSVGVLNLVNDRLTVFTSYPHGNYSSEYIRSEVEEDFIIHDYNNWSV